MAWLAAAVRDPAPMPSHPYFEGDSVLVIAHRGGRDLGPENTLPLFRQAVAMQVDVLEMDVHLSGDGVLVVHHDRTVARTTDGSGRVDSFSVAELQALDAGYRWSQDGTSFPFRAKGYRIPTLAEVFAAFPGQRMLIEIKGGGTAAARSLCGAIREYRMLDRVSVASFAAEPQRAFRGECPSLTSAVTGEVVGYALLHLLRLGDLYTPDFALFQVMEQVGALTLVDQRFVHEAHRRNLPVQVWTVNNEEDMKRLIAMGVDGIMTDRPDRLLSILAEGGSGE